VTMRINKGLADHEPVCVGDKGVLHVRRGKSRDSGFQVGASALSVK
jgi:hypothetical protein